MCGSGGATEDTDGSLPSSRDDCSFEHRPCEGAPTLVARRVFGVVSWGRAGGAPRLLWTSAVLAQRHGVELHVGLSSECELLDQVSAIAPTVTVAHMPRHRGAMAFASPQAKRQAASLVEGLMCRGVSRLVNLFPHPWDRPLREACRHNDIQFVQAIHDARKHPGDIWPTDRGIRSRVDGADEVIFFSQFVADQFRDIGKPTSVLPLVDTPLTRPSRDLTISVGPTPGPKRVVFVGRLLPYKGLDLLINAWALRRTPSTLSIAGRGSMPRIRDSSILVSRRWLGHEEVESLVAGADVLVLPYIEASQSGLIPIARALGTPVVVTPVGGLPEQVIDGVSGVVAQRVTPAAVAEAIDLALATPWPATMPRLDEKSFVKGLVGS